jgi:benzoylformate decarboxylase
MGGESARRESFVGVDLDRPPIDFVALAHSMGLRAMLIEKANDIGAAVEAAWKSSQPVLLELPISTRR